MSRADVAGRTGAWTVALASLCLSSGLCLSIFELMRGYHNPYASEPEVLMRAVLSVTLKWRVVVFWAEVIGLVGVLRNQTQFVKIWAIASGADLTGQCLVGAVIALLHFNPQLSQPFADFVCAELTRVELITSTVETCEDNFADNVLLALALGAAYLAAKGAAVAVIFAHFTSLRAAMNKVVYPGYEWNQLDEVKDGETSSGRRSSSASFSPPRRRRSSSGSSVASGARPNRSDSLPSYSAAAVEAGQQYPPSQPPPFGRRKSHTVSHSHSHRPRLVLVPVFAHDSIGSPSSSRSSSSSSRAHSPSSPFPPLYAFDAPIYSPSVSGSGSASGSGSRTRSASAGYPAHSAIPTWHDIPEVRSYSTRRLSHGPMAGAAMGRPVHGSLFGVTATTEEPETYIDMSPPAQTPAGSPSQSRKTSMEV